MYTKKKLVNGFKEAGICTWCGDYITGMCYFTLML